MKHKVTLGLVLLVAAVGISSAQPRPDSRPAAVTGTVHDENLNVPIEYANIIIYQQRDGLQVNGTVTGLDGKFRLSGIPAGSYNLEVSFIGYETRKVADLQLEAGEVLNTGLVRLPQRLIRVEGVEAVADRPRLTYKIDKKVVEVSRMATAASGTAVEVLENVSSVEVDIEGNISLRGSENFTVLIDGRPSILEASDVLQQTPASTIENIEIITNPSAKYDPDGVSGIINIILKKKRESGISGVFNANVGLGKKYGTDFLLNGRTGILTAFIGADNNTREYPGSRASESWTGRGDTTWHTSATGKTTRDQPSHGVRAGAELQLTGADRLSFGGSYGGRAMEGTNDLVFTEWSVPGDTGRFLSAGTWRRKGSHFAFDIDHQHDFAANGHNILARASWSGRDADEESTTELHPDSTRADTIGGWRTTEAGPRSRVTLKLDYTLPLRKTDRLEAGYQGQLRWSADTNEAYEFDPGQNSYQLRPEYSHKTNYTRDIHALYSLYAGAIDKSGFQVGLRGERTDRAIVLVGEPDTFAVARWDVFPSAHLSHQLPAQQQLTASYARRIQRPRWWSLEPFPTWRDAYTVRQGNPALEPEYIDSYEASYRLPFGPNRLSVEGYYRVVHDKIERVQSVFAPNVILHSYDNVGTDHSLGVETVLNLSPFDWWTVNLMGDGYSYRVAAGDTPRTSLNWRTRVGSEFKLPTGTRLQASGSYHSPSATSQGEREGFLMTDVAVRQELFGRRLSLTLQVNDVLGTGVNEFTSEGERFYSHTRFTRDAPVVMLNVSYKFNNFRLRRRPPGGGDEDEEEEY